MLTIMDKYKQLIKNAGILTIGQFGTKIFVFLLVPLYTSILSTEQYCIYEIIYTSVRLLFPVLTLDISVATQRFLLDKDADEDQILAISLRYLRNAILITLLILIANHFLQVSKLLKDYEISFFLMFLANGLNTILIEAAVGMNRVKVVSISGIIATATMILYNLLFLIVIPLGLNGYFLANILSPLVQSIYIIIVLKISVINSTIIIDKNLKKEMTRFSAPQVANNASWWVSNASDRYIVTAFCGLNTNGIYSIGYKIPSILNVLQNIFGQVWGISAIKNYNENDSDGFFSKTYSAYNFLMVTSCSLIILGTKLIASIMYSKDFYEAWKYVPLLLISNVFGAMAGYLGAFFSAQKEGGKFARSTVFGALSNIAMNFMFVPIIGAQGAALATCFSYFFVWIIRYRMSKKYISLKIKIVRDIVTYVILMAQSILIIYYQSNNFFLYALEILFMLIIILLNWENTKEIIIGLKNQIMKEDK